jgi:GAF domain-containing protein
MLQENVAAELAREVGDLLSIAGASQGRSLHRLALLASRQVPACSGATSAVWRDGEPADMAATHPDLAELFERCRQAGKSPWTEALATGQTAACPDTLAEERWPEYASAALYRGVRCSVTLVHASGLAAITLSLFGARPRTLDPDDIALAGLLVAFGGAIMGNASVYADSQRTALQLRDAVDSRTLVDQAKGILMHSLGCTAQEAFDKMRAISQTRNVKVADVAGKIIDTHRSQAG